MNFMPFNMLETASASVPGAEVSAIPTDTAAAVDSAESALFSETITALLDEENAVFSQSQRPSEPAVQTATNNTEALAPRFTLPEIATLSEPGKAVGRPTPIDAPISGITQLTAGQIKESQPLNKAIGGNSLPLSGTAFPPQLTSVEASPMTSVAHEKTRPLSAPLSAVQPPHPYTDIDSVQRLQTGIDRQSDTVKTRETLPEAIEIRSQQQESTGRERTFHSPTPSPTSAPNNVAASGTDFTVGLQLNSVNPTASNAQNQGVATVTPGFDSIAEFQQPSETRLLTTKAETPLKELLMTPVGNIRWHADFAGKLRVLTQANVSSVELNLNPAELGVIDIKIQALDDGTVINFFSANANTREVIDASLPRLRELLADSGIQLHHGDVSERQAQAEHSQREPRGSIPIDLPEELNEFHPDTRRRIDTHSMIDHYV